MKKISILLLLVATAVYPQGDKYERIKALKTAYITEQLGLSPAEAERFWPVYNTFESKSQELRLRKNKGGDLNKGTENLTTEEANRLIEEYLSIEAAQLDNKKQKIQALRKVLSPQKIIGLRRAEDRFKHELLNRYHRGKGTKGKKE